MQQRRVLVNGLWQSWPQVEREQTVCEMLLSHQPDKFVFVQASNRAAAAAAPTRETLSLADLVSKARELGLPTRFALRTGDVVVVQSPGNWLLGITSVLACLVEGITVLPISVEVTPRQVFDIIGACTRATAVGRRVVMLAPRQQLWDLDYVLAQFGAGAGSLGGEGDFPPWCESDLTCGLDPKLPRLLPAHHARHDLDEACMFFYCEHTGALLEACGENVRAFCQGIAAPAPTAVFKLDSLTWLGVILPNLCSLASPKPLLFTSKQQLHRLRRPTPAPPPDTEELSQVVQLLLKLDSRCGARLAGGNRCVEVLGPWCFRRTLVPGGGNGFVLDQRTMAWWFSAQATGWLTVSEERVVSSLPAASKRAIKPVRRVQARL